MKTPRKQRFEQAFMERLIKNCVLDAMAGVVFGSPGGRDVLWHYKDDIAWQTAKRLTDNLHLREIRRILH